LHNVNLCSHGSSNVSSHSWSYWLGLKHNQYCLLTRFVTIKVSILSDDGAKIPSEHDHGHDHGHEKPGNVPLTVPSQTPIADEIGLSTFDVVSETQLSIDQAKPDSRDHLEHRHKVKKSGGHHNHDYGMAGVLLHIAGDAINNVGVIIAGLIIWKTDSPHRFYADPAVSMFIALMILFSSLPLGKKHNSNVLHLQALIITSVKRTGHILLQSPPSGIDVDDIKHDLEKVRFHLYP
jgi:solute carrier family 30 (zinc transporter), member 1